jgi:hypothetical protein
MRCRALSAFRANTRLRTWGSSEGPSTHRAGHRVRLSCPRARDAPSASPRHTPPLPSSQYPIQERCQVKEGEGFLAAGKKTCGYEPSGCIYVERSVWDVLGRPLTNREIWLARKISIWSGDSPPCNNDGLCKKKGSYAKGRAAPKSL